MHVPLFDFICPLNLSVRFDGRWKRLSRRARAGTLCANYDDPDDRMGFARFINAISCIFRLNALLSSSRGNKAVSNSFPIFLFPFTRFCAARSHRNSPFPSVLGWIYSLSLYPFFRKKKKRRRRNDNGVHYSAQPPRRCSPTCLMQVDTLDRLTRFPSGPIVSVRCGELRFFDLILLISFTREEHETQNAVSDSRNRWFQVRAGSAMEFDARSLLHPGSLRGLFSNLQSFPARKINSHLERLTARRWIFKLVEKSIVSSGTCYFLRYSMSDGFSLSFCFCPIFNIHVKLHTREVTSRGEFYENTSRT